MISIDSKASFVTSIHRDFGTERIKNEPMLFNNDLDGAWDNGDVITRVFLDHLPKAWQNVPLVIDSRVHMLMPGWFPCIPGWHHDDVPRTRSDGQPEYEQPTDRAEHIMMLVNSHLAPTEFALGKQSFRVPELGETIYEKWHGVVSDMVSVEALDVIQAPDRTLIKFDDRTWHRGVAATGNGWRFFIRASRYWDADGNVKKRFGNRSNEVRKQVQVYMSAENAGW